MSCLRKKVRSSVILLFCLLIIGCSSITQQEAQVAALQFVDKHVKFYASEEDEKKDIPAYKITSTDSYESEGEWVVVMHVESTNDSETKKSDIEVKVNSKGEVIEFNGQKVK